MTPNQYRTAIATLGMSQVEAGVFLGVSTRTSHGYANGEYPVPLAISRLLRMMIRLGMTPAAAE